MTDLRTAEEQLAAGSITSWPTTEQFTNEATRDEACAYAAAELLEVIGPLSRAQIRLEKLNIPVAIKAIFNQKVSVAVRNLYAAMPNQVVEQVKYHVLVEQAGGPEKFAELVAKFEAEQKADAGEVVSTGSTSVSKTDSSDSNSDFPAITELPRIPEQWPAQLGADGQLHIVKEPEQAPAKVLQFKRPKPPTEPDGPSGGTPVAAAA